MSVQDVTRWERDENWIVEETRFLPEHLAKFETLFTQGNGYLGQRAALDEYYVSQRRNLFVSGTFDRFHDSEVTELPNLPDVTNMTILVNGKTFSLLSGTLENYRRTLNLHNGELERTVRWCSGDGVDLRLRWRRVVSLADVHLLASRVEIIPETDVELTLISGIDGRVTNTGTQHTVEGAARVYDGYILEYPTRTLNSSIQIVTHAAHHLLLDGAPVADSMQIVTDRRYLAGKYTLQVAAGQTVVLEKLASVHTARDLEYADLEAGAANEQVLRDSLTHFRQVCQSRYEDVVWRSAGVWRQFWEKQDIRIETRHAFDQLAIRFAVYHLNIMTNRRDNRTGVAAKGLSGEGYKGHSFWDTEIFIFPFFLFTQPEVSRTLLEYRYRTLDSARRRAKEYGCMGAMYPWESAWVDDGDATPDNLGVDLVTGKLLPCETGRSELHVTADIAYAVHQYHAATGDRAFMEHGGYEIILETARFWASRLEWNRDRGRYELCHVIGPDEYQVDVDNNAYTNYLVARNLQLGLQALTALEASPGLREKLDRKIGLCGLRELLRERLDGLYLPQPDAQTGIVPQFDGYFDRKPLELSRYRNASRVAEIMKDFNFEMLRQYQVAKQADVVQLLYLCEELFPEDLRRKNYLYYEPRTLHDSSLSKTVHSVLASDLGLVEEAYRMFVSAAKTDLGPEPDSCDAGIHSANMGGMWQDVVMGFGGLRLTAEGLRIAPHLPEPWNRLQYHVCWQGRRLDVTVTREALRIFNHGAALQLNLCGVPTELAANGETVVRLERGEMDCSENSCHCAG